MQNIFIDILPPWVETGLQPAFYDLESGTVLQQTARMYAKVRELTEGFNTFTENVTNEIDTFEQDTNDEIERFEGVVNDTVEEYIKKFNDLHDYVQDYFDNLDVQEEINNKLDEMVEDGVLQEIITTYIQSNVAWTFDTVADMKAATNLVNGSFARTLGFYTRDDGNGALYKIRSLEEGESADEMGVIAITGASAGIVADIVIEGDEINAGSFGIKSDGINDDAFNIKAAIDRACDYIIQKQVATGSFAGPITVSLPDTKMFIKSQITCNQAINIVGSGTNSTLVLSDDIDYMIKIEGVSGTSVTTNEETHLEGGSVRQLRFDGSSRAYTCTAALHVGFTDHFVADSLYFMCIKGKCIEVEAFRESNINNIFTRYCGVYGSGCIEIITNHLGGDTSNLNFGENWNIIYPFGNAIKFVDGEFHFVNNVVIHGMFQGIIDSLETYFGTNDYEDTDNDFIYLNHSNPTFTSVSGVYCPDKSTYCKQINSTATFNSTWFQTHKSTNEQHNGYGNFFDLSSSSVLKIYNVQCTCGGQSADLIKTDSGSKVEGCIVNSNSTYLYSDVNDYKRATRFTFEGEMAQPVIMGYKRGDCFKSYGKNQRAHLIFKQTDPINSLTLNSDALYIGTNQYQSRTVVAIPDEGMFALPKVTSSNLSYTVNHAIFFDENNNLKYMYYDDNTSGWIVKTVTSS